MCPTSAKSESSSPDNTTSIILIIVLPLVCIIGSCFCGLLFIVGFAVLGVTGVGGTFFVGLKKAKRGQSIYPEEEIE